METAPTPTASTRTSKISPTKSGNQVATVNETLLGFGYSPQESTRDTKWRETSSCCGKCLREFPAKEMHIRTIYNVPVALCGSCLNIYDNFAVVPPACPTAKAK